MNNQSCLSTPEQALRKLISGNNAYIRTCQNPANVTCARREETTRFGQAPYAVVLTCSDSLVPPEHIFTAGIGDLFVVRTAGNAVGAFEIGSVAYALKHLRTPLVVVMGHTHCGAVTGVLRGDSGGYTAELADEIGMGVGMAASEEEAVANNTAHARQRLLQSDVVRQLSQAGEVRVVCAVYDIHSGCVHFLDD